MKYKYKARAYIKRKTDLRLLISISLIKYYTNNYTSLVDY
jgi:hypothetical protein